MLEAAFTLGNARTPRIYYLPTFLLILGLWLLLPGFARACPSSYCGTPTTPDAPYFEPSPSTDGNFQVKVPPSGGGNYANIELYSYNKNGVVGEAREPYGGDPTVFTVTGEASGIYTFKARSCWVSNGDCSSWSSSAGVHVVKKPGNPVLSVGGISACETSLSVSWSPSGSGYPSGAVKRYDLQELVNGSWITRRNNSTSTSWSRSISQNSTYKYRLRARYVWDGYTSPPTGWISKSVTAPRCAPGNVTNLTIKQNNPVATSTEVEANWGAAPSGVGVIADYKAERQKEGETTWNLQCNLPHENYIETYVCKYSSVIRGQKYRYRVQAYNAVNEGGWSTTPWQYVQYAKPSPPGAVEKPFQQESDPYDYSVNWDGSGIKTTNTGDVSFEVRENNGSWIDAGTATSKNYYDKAATTNYTYQVRACNPDNTCSTVFTVGTINIPGKPGAIQVSNVEDYGRDYKLNWAAASGSVSEYKLEQSVNGSDWTETSEDVNNAVAGTNIRYRVSACNSNACGPYSAVRSYWVPQPPTLQASIDAVVPEVNLSWSDGADHFRLEEYTSGSWNLVDGDYRNTEYTISAIHGASYRYRVKACNADNACSAPADPDWQRVPPAIPAGVDAAQPDPVNSSDVSIIWSRPSGDLDGYYLERKNVTTASAYTRIATLPGEDSTSYVDSTVQPGQQYRWRVQSYKTFSSGELQSTYSSATSALKVQYPAPVVGLNASVGEGATQGTDPSINYWAGYQGIYTVLWELTGGTADENGVQMSEQLPGSSSWQPGSVTAQNCNSGECEYDKPFNDSGVTRVYDYKAVACSPDAHCDNRQISVGVLSYPKPGAPTAFDLSAPATSAGNYTLQWSAPANTPPNATGEQAEPVSYYELRRIQPALAQPWSATHSDTRSQPYIQSISGGVSGRSYTYEVVACFQPDEPNAERGCSEPAAPITVYVPHGQPTGLAHTDPEPEEGSFTLSWNVPAGDPVHHYVVEESLAGSPVQTYSTSSASYDFSGKVNGKTYSYRVQACGEGGECGDYSVSHLVDIPYAVPSVPTDLHWVARDDAQGLLTLAWNAPSSGKVAVYTVEQRAGSESAWSHLDTTAQLSTEATDLSLGETYSFHVRACASADEDPASCGEYSSSMNDSIAYQAPNTPGAMSHDTNDIEPATGTFTVHWQAPATIDPDTAPVTYYQLDYSIGDAIWLAIPNGANGQISVSNPSPGQTAQSTQMGMDAGVAYNLRISACNPDACSPPTQPHALYLPYPAPAAPSWLPTTPSEEDYQARRFTIEWLEPGGFVHHYALQSWDDAEAAWIAVADSTQSVNYTLSNSEYGRTYRFQVRACSEPGAPLGSCSSWSESAPVRLKFPEPQAPSGLEVRDLDKVAGKFTLAWEQLMGWAPEYRYELQENPNSSGWGSLTEMADPVTEYPVSGLDPGVYRYRVRACNPAPDNDCGGWSPAVLADLYLNVDLEYQYDALGRLIQVDKDGNPQTGYCYDKAGNRYQLLEGLGNDVCGD